jgi:hypothetical protein
MESWQYGLLYVTRARLPQGSATEEYRIAFVDLAEGPTVYDVERLVILFDQLGADGWLIGEPAPVKLPEWCAAEVLRRGLVYSPTDPTRYVMRRRLG